MADIDQKDLIPLKIPSELQALAGKRVYVETYGCTYNFGDTANLVEILKKIGASIVETPEKSDVVIINTCTVVGPTERRMLRRLIKFDDKPLFVTGCMSMVQREAIFAVCSPVIIPPQMIRDVYSRIKTVSCGGAGIVQVAQGCVGNCSYCITRTARGPLKSFSEDEIIDKTRAFIRAGAPEIQLTAQDLSSWGLDLGRTLPSLLEKLTAIPGNYRIRIGMINPATVKPILPELVEVLGGDHLFRFIHLPVQSGSDTVLSQMKRGYSVQDFKKIVSTFRNRYPDISLVTDMIVGFPGETPDDFNQSLALLNRMRLNKVNITRYSARPFTGPFLEKDFPDFVKKDRSRILNTCAKKIYTALNAPLLETIQPVIVTEKLRKGSVMARTPTYQGVVIKEDLPLGFTGNVRITHDRHYFFTGERVS
jgi:MiaB-like tRNA modifying enzyme